MTFEFTERSRNARANILAKLKKEVSGADYDKLPEEKPYQYGEITDEQMFEQFTLHLTNNQAQLIKVEQQHVAITVQKELAKRKLNSLLYGKHGKYAEQLEQTFVKNSASECQLVPYDFALTDNKEKVFNELPASITSSKWAIAETGTIVLWPTPEEPRTLSLIPPVHFVVVDVRTMYRNFASLVEAQCWNERMPTNALLISGPSKTADIQQTLAFGAHGPKELIVLLINAD